ncbi:MAG: acylneuraminate cytidylyltransferase [Anaerolineales bacterium]|nr:acylneuraminate cytidylyltransferase [Anaerolineales bacterium]
MVARPHVLAIVPARGGSKSIPRKNIRPFCGQPLIAYSIAAGLQAETVERVLVSTDDHEIAEIARQLGAEVPVLRPAALATDETTDLPVFRHALLWLEQEQSYRPDLVVQLRPTSPVRPRSLVDQAVRLLADHPEADSVRGVVPSGQNPHKMWQVSPDGRLRPLLEVQGVPEAYNAPRQALPPTFWQTGHIDVFRRSTVMDKGSMSGDAILPVLIDPAYSVDIDTSRDWERAEWLLESGDLDAVRVGPSKRRLPESVSLLVMDFDGVLTDDRVWVDQDGGEAVAASRADGMGLARLRQAGIPAIVLSSETNPVVAARCRKLGIEAIQGVGDKGQALLEILRSQGVPAHSTVYVGNDLNDLPCFPLVGWAVAVADARPPVRLAADYVLRNPGGHGAVRELCDLVLEQTHKR